MKNELRFVQQNELQTGNYIGGKFRELDASSSFTSYSPGDRELALNRFSSSVKEANEAIAFACQAKRMWRHTDRAEREALLLRYRDALKSHEEEMATWIALETGKPLWDARGEARALSAKVDLMLGKGAEATRDREVPAVGGFLRYRPHGVMAVIGPFNFPVHLPNGQIVPSLLHGNTVIFKPSEKTPNAAALLARCIDEAGFPPGVFQLVQGDAKVAKGLVSHDDIDGILFTGSRSVGQFIVQENISRLDRIIALELGGKNTSIVLDDANLKWTVRQLVFAAFASAGQRCTATSRVFATPGIRNALAKELAEAASRIKVGFPLDESVFMGPMISHSSRDALQVALGNARRAGFSVLAKADVPRVVFEGLPRDGAYVRPSVYQAPSLGIHVDGYTHEELFGPNLALYPAKNLQEAVAAANDTDYGLAGSLFGGSREVFETAALDWQAGVLNWNQSTAGASGQLPFGGVKASGNHRPAGIDAAKFCAWPQASLCGDPTKELPEFPGL